MAMLAAPRRKQKVVNLRAKNNAWSNDPNKFGQRMLEKMGWSEGKGLGAKESGIVEHVVARFKNDDRGLGYEDRNDQWTKHEDDFNSLLANLSNGDNNDEKLHSGVSLEVKSKKSKARVHYHKFTRGKDLTRYSEKDLANIFGKKSLKNKNKEKEVKSEENEDINTTDSVFTDKGSMVDYFKNKLANFKSKNNISLNSSYDDDRADCGFKGFSGAGNDDMDAESHQVFSFQGFSSCNSEENKIEIKNEVSNICVENEKKSKKKKKNKNQELVQIENLIVVNTEEHNNIVHDQDISEMPQDKEKVKKSKKKKHATSDLEEPIQESVENKKSKKKNKVIETFEEHATEEYVPKKKKKRKNKDIDHQ